MKKINAATAMQPYYPAAPRSTAWVLVDQKVCELKVMRVETVHVAKENVYGNELPYTERITYTLKGGIQRTADQVFRSREELISSL